MPNPIDSPRSKAETAPATNNLDQYEIRILHVEDEPDLADLTVEFLQREDDRFRIETATNPSDGLARLADKSFDCIISDYEMPGQNGVEFLEAVRAEYPDLPFILYTGKGSEEVASDAISAGVTDYLQKGSGSGKYRILANRVRNAVERYWLEREADHTRTQLQAIAHNSADAILLIDTESRIHFANQSIEDHFGYTPSELHGERLTKLMPERHREDYLTGISQYVENDERSLNWSHVEFPGRHKDGTEIPLSISFSEFEQDGERRFIGTLRNISEQVRMEKLLDKRQERFRQVAENIREVVWMSDPGKNDLLYVNSAYEEIWGRSVDSLYNDPTSFLDAIHPEDRERVETAIERQAAGGYDEEYRIIRSDGERRWVHDRAVPVENDAGDVYRIVGIVSDITERKEEERKREQIIDRVTDAIVEVNADWEFTLVNDQAETLYDMDESSLLGRNFWEVFHEAQDTRFEEEYRHVMESREPTTFVEYFSQLDGWFDIEAYPKEDGGIAFYFIEVTDQRERQHELEQTNTLLSTLFETLPVGVTVLDTDGTITRANQRAEEVLGLTESEITKRTYDDPEWQIVDEDGEPVPDDDLPFARVMETGETVIDYEHGIKGPDGSERWLSINATPLRTDTEAIEQVVAVISDITDQRDQEQAIRHQNERLEEFASTVSHDLRNPLNVAEGRLELAQEECESEHLDQIDTALDRMTRIIEDVLWLARESRDIGSTEPVEIQHAVESAWNLVADSADRAELRYATDKSRLLQIRADYDRLCQLLENLLRNAVVHGGDDVTVTVGSLDSGFYLEDDGPGIPDDNHDEVFSSGYSTGEFGKGIGLSVVEQVVEAHDWEIHVTEGSEGGARFEIIGVEFVPE